jgi:hypothetical protein
MSDYRRKTDFFETEEGQKIQQSLIEMALSSEYNTTSSYSPNTKEFPDNIAPFVGRHLDYLKNHPTINPQQYISNLKLMTKVR